MISQRSRRDDGAMLIFALILITVIAVVTGALLALGGAKLDATIALRTVAGNAYAADAAAKIAVNDIEWGGSSTVPTTTGSGSIPNGSCSATGGTACYPNGANGTPSGWVFDNNTDGTGCFGQSTGSGNPPLTQITLPNFYTDPHSGAKQTATVVCSGVQGTGLFGSGSQVLVSGTDPFSRALTTVGPAGQSGIPDCSANSSSTVSSGVYIKGLGGPIPIRGSIESNSCIQVDNGALLSSGTVTANPNSSCGHNVSGSYLTACSGSYVTPSSDGSPLSSVPGYKDASTQNCNFQPGFYNSGASLSTWTNKTNCPGGVTFASGIYYFDFADGVPWTVTNRVVGGNAVPGHSIPGACVSPIGSLSSTGVQFVFGYTSQMILGQGSSSPQIELCGPTNGGNAPLTLYQQQAGSTPTSQNIGPNASGAVTTLPTVANRNDAFTATGSGATLTNAVADTATPAKTDDWKATAKGNGGELDLANLGLASIPVGATINSANLAVTYKSGLSNGATFTANIAGQPAGSAVSLPAASSTSYVTNSVSLASLLQAQLNTGAFNSTSRPTVQLQIAATNKNDTMSVDKVALSVTYTPAALRAAPSAQAFITSGTNFAGQFVVEGATYAPKGYINVNPGGTGSLVSFRWGILAYGVGIQSQPAQLFGYPLISIPDVGYGFGSAVTAVDIKVYLCTGSSPCSTSGRSALTSRVEFTDKLDANGILSPIPGQRQVTVLSWAEQR